MLKLAAAVLVGVGGSLLAGCKDSSRQTTLRLALEGDAQAKAALEELIKQNPTLINPTSGTKYSILIVEPDPNVDYKIARVMPDPDVDYKIIIVDPESGKEIPGITKRLADALQKHARQKRGQAKE